MVHTVSTAEEGRVYPYFQRLWSTLLAPDSDFGSKLAQLFVDETAEFKLAYAFLTRIDLDTEMQHFEHVHGSHGPLKEGNTVSLSVTYCRKTIVAPEGTLVVDDARAEGWGDDPAYETFDLASYVGTTVTVEDELYGTLCFANTTPREQSITAEEKTLVEMLGQWVAYELNQWTGPPTESALDVELDQHEISSEEIDSMMDALGNRIRRVTLLALTDDATECTVDDLIQTIDGDHVRAKLYHSHLPRLQQPGYIEWNQEKNTISRGPNFFEVEPLLRQLKEHTPEFSE